MKVSIIIPCYNQGVFLNETCQSILNQTHKDWEALIINDGSTDDTQNIALKICHTDSRFKYHKKVNGGLSSARNLGLEKSEGEYIQFLDSDDILLPKKLELSLHETSDLIITNFQMLENGEFLPPFCQLNGQIINYENILLKWDIDFSIPIHCGMFKSEIAKEIKFNESLKAKEDWLFWLDFLINTSHVAFINKPLVLYRLHNSSMTKDNSHMLKNTEQVYLIIYNKLTEKYRKLFYGRLNSEFLKAQIKADYLFLRNSREKLKRKFLMYLSIFLFMVILFLFIKSFY
jgi:glycosyltransferase involved in cell wall biosynthesis